MKWYNYSLQWINIEYCNHIKVSARTSHIELFMNNGDIIDFYYKDSKERDAEFEKIKALMGVYDEEMKCLEREAKMKIIESQIEAGGLYGWTS